MLNSFTHTLVRVLLLLVAVHVVPNPRAVVSDHVVIMKGMPPGLVKLWLPPTDAIRLIYGKDPQLPSI